VDEGISSVGIPDTTIPLTPEQYQDLVDNIDPLKESESYGVDIFHQVVTFCNNIHVPWHD